MWLANKRDHHEINTPGLVDSTTMTSAITTVAALMNDGKGGGGDDDTFEDAGNGDNDGDSDHTDRDEDGDPQSQSSGDTAIHGAMKEAKVKCFKDLDDMNGIIDAYECLTGNRIHIEKSQKTSMVYTSAVCMYIVLSKFVSPSNE